MADFVRGSSSVFRIEAHMSFKTKYSHNVFDIVEFKQRCTELLLGAAAGAGVEITEHGYDRNHVHLDVRWTRISLSVDQTQSTSREPQAGGSSRSSPASRGASSGAPASGRRSSTATASAGSPRRYAATSATRG